MKVKILQWNVRFSEHPKDIAKELKRFEADIICCQELIETERGINAVQIISEYLKYDYFFKEAARWDNRLDIISQGNAIFSRFPIKEALFAFLRFFIKNPANSTVEGRVYLEAEIVVGRKIINIGTTHLSFSRDHGINKEKQEEVKKLLSLIKDKHYILTGDFNATPDDLGLQKVFKKLNNAGPDLGIGTTKPIIYHGIKEPLRIDYVFTTSDIKVNSAKVLESEFSDHLPILIEIEV
jgi:endonuclease/exonuclease/phosphatase family metal-dependent hydrolase